MASPVRIDPVTALVAALAKVGRPGREAAVRLDLVRATGPRVALHRWQDDRGARRSAGTGGAPSPFRTIWSEAAAELGADVRDLGDGYLEIAAGGSSTLVWNHWVPLDDIVTARLALEKHLVHERLTAAGIPVPEHRVFARADVGRAAEYVEASPGPYVVKPAAASGGGGVTSGVETRSQLIRAAIRAGRLDDRILVERLVPGEVYRLLLLDGELLGAVRRRPPTVTGNGRSTIHALIVAENSRRAAHGGTGPLQPLRVDLDCAFALARQGIALGSVPAPGVSVQVKTVVSQNAPEENETIHGAELAPALVAEAQGAAAAVGVRLAGIDVVTTDHGRSLAEAGGVVLEVNATPGLHYHYQVREPDAASRVAVPILRKLLGA